MTSTNPLEGKTFSHLLQGKVAIVTGGNSGIGKAIVEYLAELGAQVVIDYRSHPEATEELEREIGAYGGCSFGVQADVSKLDEIQRLIDAAVAQFGRIDVMVNNAGVETRTSVLNTTPEQYDKVLDVNLRGVFFATQYAAKQMIAQGDGGRIINISSVHEDWPMPGNTAYCLAKGGVRMLTRTAALELAPHGINIVNVGPGAVATPINDSTMNDPELMANLRRQQRSSSDLCQWSLPRKTNFRCTPKAAGLEFRCGWDLGSEVPRSGWLSARAPTISTWQR